MRMIEELPRLDGRIGVAVRVGYVLLAILTTIIVVGSLIVNGLDFFRNMPADSLWGFRTFSSTEIGVPPFIGWISPEARAAGLRESDVFVAIQGKALPPGATEYSIGKRMNAIEGNSATVVTRRTDGSVGTHVLPRHGGVWLRRDALSSDLPFWVYSTFTFLGMEVIPVFLLCASLLLFGRRPADAEAMLFAFGFLLLCNVPVVDEWLNVIVLIPLWVLDVMAGAGQCLVIVAAAGFPQGRFDSRWSRAVLLSALPLTLLSTWAHRSAAVPAAGALISGGILLLLSSVAMLGLARRYRLTEIGAARQQIKWTVLGFCVSAVATIAYSALLHSSFSQTQSVAGFIGYQFLQIAAFLALPLGLVVSLLRYRLYDAEATISRSAAYVLLTASLVVLFAATEKLIEQLGSNLLGGNVGAIAGGVSAGIAAVMFAPMHHRIDNWAQRRFRHGLVRLREGLPGLVGDLREVASVEQIARAVLERVSDGVHARHLALVAGDRLLATRDIDAGAVEAWRADHAAGLADVRRIARSDGLFPLRVPLLIEEETRIGHLLLGPRPDGSFYGMDELETLSEIAEPIARAIMVCRQREAANLSIVAQMEALSARIARIERGLVPLQGN